MFETERSGLGAASLAELLLVVSLADGPRGGPSNHAGELYQPLLDMMAQAALSRFGQYVGNSQHRAKPKQLEK